MEVSNPDGGGLLIPHAKEPGAANILSEGSSRVAKNGSPTIIFAIEDKATVETCPVDHVKKAECNSHHLLATHGHNV